MCLSCQTILLVPCPGQSGASVAVHLVSQRSLAASDLRPGACALVQPLRAAHAWGGCWMSLEGPRLGSEMQAGRQRAERTCQQPRAVGGDHPVGSAHVCAEAVQAARADERADFGAPRRCTESANQRPCSRSAVRRTLGTGSLGWSTGQRLPLPCVHTDSCPLTGCSCCPVALEAGLGQAPEP